MLDLKKYQKITKDLQSGMEGMKEELAAKSVEGVAGGGALTVTCNGNQEITAIKISPEAVDPDDIQMLEDLRIPEIRVELECTEKPVSANREPR